MALIVCPECGGKVSDKAYMCPHCGFPPSTLKDSKTTGFYHSRRTLLYAFLVLIIVWLFLDSPPPKKRSSLSDRTHKSQHLNK